MRSAALCLVLLGVTLCEGTIFLNKHTEGHIYPCIWVIFRKAPPRNGLTTTTMATPMTETPTTTVAAAETTIATTTETAAEETTATDDATAAPADADAEAAT